MRPGTKYVQILVIIFFTVSAMPLEEAQARVSFGERREDVKRRSHKGGRRAQALFDRVQQAYLSGDMQQVLTQGANFIKRYPKNRRVDQALHAMALADLNQGNTVGARKDLMRLKSYYPRSRILDQVDLAVGESFFLEGKTDAAIETWKRALRAYPDTTYKVLYLDRLARAHEKKGAFGEARRRYMQIVRFFPDSIEAQDASAKLNGDGLYFTVQVGSFSSQSNAKKLTSQLRDIGMEPRLSTRRNAGHVFYRVRVGQFDTKKDAQLLASRLRKQGYLTKIYP